MGAAFGDNRGQAAARTEFDRARSASPDSPFVAALCLWFRDYACTIAAAEHQAETTSASSQQMGARPAFIAVCSGVAYLMTGRFNKAVQQFQYGVDHTEADAGASLYLALGLAAAKRNAEAEKIVVEVKQHLAEHYIPVYRLAAYYGYIGNNDEAFRWLEMAADPKSLQYDTAWLGFLKVDPLMDSLRHDPRYSKLVKKIGFPPQ